MRGFESVVERVEAREGVRTLRRKRGDLSV